MKKMLLSLFMIFTFFSCSFMDSSWGKNNATITEYYDEDGNKLGIQLNFMTVESILDIPEYIAGEKVVYLKFDDVSSKTSTTSITFPDSVIAFDTLAGFTSLQSLTLSKNLEKIKEKSFSSCKSLKTITLTNPTPPSISLNDVNYLNTFSSLVIYLPKDSIEIYSNAANWSEIKDKFTTIESQEDTSEETSETETESTETETTDTETSQTESSGTGTSESGSSTTDTSESSTSTTDTN